MRPNLAVLRSALAPMLTDAGQVGRMEWADVDGDGLEEETFVAYFTGPVLIRPEGVQVITVGGTSIPQTRYDVTLPADVVPLIGDTFKITDSADPALVGLELTLTDVSLDSYVVARFCKAERQ